MHQPGSDHDCHVVVTGEQRHCFAVALDLTPVQAGGRVVFQESAKLPVQLLERLHHHGQPLFHAFPADLQGIGNTGEVHAIDFCRQQGFGAFAQALRIARRQHNGEGPAENGRPLLRCDVFLNQHMGIGATRTKRRNAGQARHLTQIAINLQNRAHPVGQFTLEGKR